MKTILLIKTEGKGTLWADSNKGLLRSNCSIVDDFVTYYFPLNKERFEKTKSFNEQLIYERRSRNMLYAADHAIDYKGNILKSRYWSTIITSEEIVSDLQYLYSNKKQGTK